MPMNRSAVALMTVAAALMTVAVAAPVAAHHSFAMFDITKSVILKGTIKDVHWSNPHVWIDIGVVTPGKPPVMWGIEAGATNTLSRQGWKRDSLKPGDTVTLEVHPMRNGSNSGSMMKATLADGTVLTLGAQGAKPS